MNRLESIKEGIKHLNFNGALLDDFNWLIEEVEKVERCEEALQEINECIEGFYDDSNPPRLYPELRKFAGYINVVSKVCKDALKS